jgi:hypothetical protein
MIVSVQGSRVEAQEMISSGKDVSYSNIPSIGYETGYILLPSPYLIDKTQQLQACPIQAVSRARA